MKRRRPTADDVLRYVAGYLEARDGISPSYQEISDTLGFGSKRTVSLNIDALERAGRLRRLRRTYRAITLTAPVAIPRTPEGQPLYFVAVP